MEWWETPEFTMVRNSIDRENTVIFTAQEWDTFLAHVRDPNG